MPLFYSTVQPGDLAPDFTLPTPDGTPVSLSSFRGKRVVLYFYPKDSTPGCTTEACDFQDHLARFKRRGVVVLGVAPGTLRSKAKFATTNQLTFPLLNDEDSAVCQAFGVWREKQLYGQKYMGVMRTTYVLDADGRVERVWEKVNEKGHAAAVNAYLLGKPDPAPVPVPRRAARKK
jgi:peroxiredoxin Q/BCP